MVNNLENYFSNYIGSKASIEEKFMTKATLELVKVICQKKYVLQLGLGNGLVARKLDEIVKEQTVLEGSHRILNKFSFKAKNTVFVGSYFEEFQSKNKYDVILANHVMEHVKKPVEVLAHIKNFLKKNGKIFITVPNANSIHRQIGVQMKLLKSEYELNTSDLKAGHQRVYDYNTLRADIEMAGLQIVDSGGYNLKMISLDQMKEWSQELLDAIFFVSQSMPKEICTNLWAICNNKRNK